MEASLNLRRHFLSRSTQLITPLARYLNTLIPSPTEVKHARKTSGFPSTPSTPSTAKQNHGLRLKPFNPTNFFASLKTHGSILPFKSTSKKTEFYERCVFFSQPDLLVTRYFLLICCVQMAQVPYFRNVASSTRTDCSDYFEWSAAICLHFLILFLSILVRNELMAKVFDKNSLSENDFCSL